MDFQVGWILRVAVFYSSANCFEQVLQFFDELGTKGQGIIRQFEVMELQSIPEEIRNIPGACSIYTRAFGGGPRNFEPWSSDEDDN
ncbi:hypothetical protein TNCV_492321 [Trichonephila clavipes]|nr:hypothetical protein TNCV_492321 [Trichonephila clavipes]